MRSALFVLSALTLTASAQTASEKSPFSLTEVMIPVRDGVHLQTVIIAPLNQTAPLPILLQRTPYGVPAKPPAPIPPAGSNSLATATSSSFKTSVDASNPKAPSISPPTLISLTPKPRTRPPMPTTPSNGSSKISPRIMVASESSGFPTTASPQP